MQSAGRYGTQHVCGFVILSGTCHSSLVQSRKASQSKAQVTMQAADTRTHTYTYAGLHPGTRSPWYTRCHMSTQSAPLLHTYTSTRVTANVKSAIVQATHRQKEIPPPLHLLTGPIENALRCKNNCMSFDSSAPTHQNKALCVAPLRGPLATKRCKMQWTAPTLQAH